MLLEVPRTEIISLQVLVHRQRKIGIQKERRDGHGYCEGQNSYTTRIANASAPYKGPKFWQPSKEVPKPRPGKVLRKVLRKVPVRNGVSRSVCVCIGDGTQALFRHFPRHPVSDRHFPKHFPKHFFGTFPGQGFGTSLDGRQDRNTRGQNSQKRFQGQTTPITCHLRPFSL